MTNYRILEKALNNLGKKSIWDTTLAGKLHFAIILVTRKLLQC